ncbi:putative inactive receptor kinase [Frankliniella fusca]|uniref:Inactive receptor kinase n=1 Tax=Frankliniella fusca TaxID=407009 RepID=A0AAE1HEW6_9NEOP|nr:putative inactive receptor kinase [Frankliniella fusca]
MDKINGRSRSLPWLIRRKAAGRGQGWEPPASKLDVHSKHTADSHMSNTLVKQMSSSVLSTPAIVGICLGASLFLVLTAAVTCVCYRRRSHWAQGHEKLGGLGKPRGSADKPLALQQHPRRPTAVKSPAGPGGPPQYLKKSPSPTGPGKSPPGVSHP